MLFLKLLFLFNFFSKKDHLVLISFYYFSVLVASLLGPCLNGFSFQGFFCLFFFPHRSSAMFIKHQPTKLHEFFFSPSLVYWPIFYKAWPKPARHCREGSKFKQ